MFDREKLGILDNKKRYARDAFALSAIINSRENVKLIAGRRTAEGEPLAVSRLLFAEQGPKIAARVLRYYKEEEATPPENPVQSEAEAKKAGLW